MSPGNRTAISAKLIIAAYYIKRPYGVSTVVPPLHRVALPIILTLLLKKTGPAVEPLVETPARTS